MNPAFTHTPLDDYTDSHTHTVVYISCQIDYKGFSPMIVSVHIRNRAWFGFSSVDFCKPDSFLEQRLHRNVHSDLGNSQRSFSIQGFKL